METNDQETTCPSCGETYDKAVWGSCPSCRHLPGAPRPQPVISTAASREGKKTPPGDPRPSEATAHFVQCIALLVFASIAAGAGATISLVTEGSASWAFPVGAIAGVVLVLLAVSAYMRGSKALTGRQ